jgi:hypothetical protein
MWVSINGREMEVGENSLIAQLVRLAYGDAEAGEDLARHVDAMQDEIGTIGGATVSIEIRQTGPDGGAPCR